MNNQPEPSRYQLLYWALLKETKTHVIYLTYYANRTENISNAINFFLAITSSTSIAAWAVWSEYQFLWAVIIGISHVATVAKPYLPYEKRLKSINNLNDNLQRILLLLEEKWFFVCEGELTNEEIHKLSISARSKSIMAEQKIMKGVQLPRQNKLLKVAEEEAALYFETHYH